jgi:hypothetical protein
MRVLERSLRHPGRGRNDDRDHRAEGQQRKMPLPMRPERGDRPRGRSLVPFMK